MIFIATQFALPARTLPACWPLGRPPTSPLPAPPTECPLPLPPPRSPPGAESLRDPSFRPWASRRWPAGRCSPASAPGSRLPASFAPSAAGAAPPAPSECPVGAATGTGGDDLFCGGLDAICAHDLGTVSCLEFGAVLDAVAALDFASGASPVFTDSLFAPPDGSPLVCGTLAVSGCCAATTAGAGALCSSGGDSATAGAATGVDPGLDWGTGLSLVGP